jgi:hypothetical protein
MGIFCGMMVEKKKKVYVGHVAIAGGGGSEVPRTLSTTHEENSM